MGSVCPTTQGCFLGWMLLSSFRGPGPLLAWMMVYLFTPCWFFFFFFCILFARYLFWFAFKAFGLKYQCFLFALKLFWCLTFYFVNLVTFCPFLCPSSSILMGEKGCVEKNRYTIVLILCLITASIQRPSIFWKVAAVEGGGVRSIMVWMRMSSIGSLGL